MEKRYQVFVSSTFRDLVEERAAVIQALLEMDAIPAGMELFTAADDDAWSLIKRVIEQSDYYVLVVGGRYGSTDGSGISFTEREFNYAIECNIPVLPFLHDSPEQIIVGKSELNPDAREKLDEFRKRVERLKYVKYWNNVEQLGSRVSRSLLRAITEKPRTGWVRADQVTPTESLQEIARLRRQVDELRARLEASRTSPPPGTEHLAQGDDLFKFEILYRALDNDGEALIASGKDATRVSYRQEYSVPFEAVFAACGPQLLQEATEKEMKASVERQLLRLLENEDALKGKYPTSLQVDDASFQVFKVQLVALGIIVKADKKKGVHDRNVYWTLTPYGESLLMKVTALRRPEK